MAYPRGLALVSALVLLVACDSASSEGAKPSKSDTATPAADGPTKGGDGPRVSDGGDAKPAHEPPPIVDDGGSGLRVVQQSRSKWEPADGPQGVTAESLTGGVVMVTIAGLGWYCSPDPEFTVGRVRDELILRPRQPEGPLTRCVEPTTVFVQLSGVEVGSYQIVVYREAEGRSVHGRTDLEVEPN